MTRSIATDHYSPNTFLFRLDSEFATLTHQSRHRCVGPTHVIIRMSSNLCERAHNDDCDLSGQHSPSRNPHKGAKVFDLMDST